MGSAGASVLKILRNADAPVGVVTSFVLVECAGRSRCTATGKKNV